MSQASFRSPGCPCASPACPFTLSRYLSIVLIPFRLWIEPYLSSLHTTLLSCQPKRLMLMRTVGLLTNCFFRLCLDFRFVVEGNHHHPPSSSSPPSPPPGQKGQSRLSSVTTKEHGLRAHCVPRRCCCRIKRPPDAHIKPGHERPWPSW